MAENPENLSGTPAPTPGASDDAAGNAFSQAELDALMQQMSVMQTGTAATPKAAEPAPAPGAAMETPIAAKAPEPPVDETTYAAAQAEVDALAAEMAAALGADVQAAAAPAAPRAANAASPTKVIGAEVAVAPEDAVTFTPPELQTAPAPSPGNLELLDDVQLDVQIELGRALMYIEDVLRLGPGSVVELNKLAGDPVDIYANGRLVAHGEVLVLNDNFCVRINQIHSPVPELAASA